jgi:predicted Zn-dependent protease with MMP-like domain
MSDWAQLLAIARAEVEETLSALPAPLHQQASLLAVTYERQPNGHLLKDGFEPDLLGLFVGSALGEAHDALLPPQVILFLENLWDFSEGDLEIYRDEIRTTYLHELGHYLGLDEGDLEERGLD